MAKANSYPEDLQRLIKAGININGTDYETDKNGRITQLDLRLREITDISWIEGMTELTVLHLDSNQISNVEPLRGLTSLTQLTLSSNQIINMEPLRGLTSLTELSLYSNQISNVVPLRGLTSLTELRLSSNQISNVEPLRGLASLKELTLYSNQISNLEPLRGLQALTELSLGSNQIRDVEPLRGLTNLNRLYLYSNQIGNLEPLRGLSELLFLSIFSNQISNLKPLQGLTNLKELFLYLNQIENLKPLLDLTNLTLLHLGSNQINNLEPLRNLSNLTRLELSSNKISNLEPLRGLTNLIECNVNDNPVKEYIPAETIAAGWPAILKYLNTTAGDRVVIKEAKLLLLGNPNVGKSDLLHYLKTHRTMPEGERTLTHGLVYEELGTIGENWKIHCWDFGGQEFYHATHQLFFSPGALHLLLWSHKDVPREKAVEEVFFETGYWLRCVEQLSRDAANSKPIETILIENKIDLQDNISMLLRQHGIQEQIAHFNNLNIHIASVSVQHGIRLGGLKELIEERVATLFNAHPAIYKAYRDRIQASGKAMLTLTEIDSSSPDERLMTAMKVLHNIGCLLYFPNMIPGKVFARPGVLLALLYKRVLHDRDKFTITAEELSMAVKGNELQLSVYEIKALLLGFHLVFCLPSKKDTYYIPQYLPVAPPWMDFFERYHFKKVYIRITSDSFLMHNALLRLFTHYAEYVKTQDGQEPMFWKDGLVIERDSQVLLIRFNRKEQCIDLYNDIEDKNFELRKGVMGFVVNLAEGERSGVEMLPSGDERKISEKEHEPGKRKMEVWESRDFDVLVSTDGIYFASLKRIVDNANRNIYYVEARDAEGNTKACSVFDFNKYLPNNRRGAMKKIFISYSKSDLELVNKFEDHLSAMKLDGKVASWYCTELRAGSNWDDEIQQHFNEADIICFMVSPNFMKTKYIHEYEIKWAVDRKNTKKDIIIMPIILNFCSWQTAGEYGLGKYTALPYKAKPVMDFENWDMAWFLVTECIRLAINNGTDLKEEDYYSQQLPTEVRDLFERIIKGDTGHKAQATDNTMAKYKGMLSQEEADQLQEYVWKSRQESS